MVAVLPAVRKTRVLTPSSLACLAHMPTVNLTAGCAHGCLYCYTRGYSTYPGEGKITFYTNTLEKIREELARKRKMPRAVYFSPSSDLFQPVPQVLELAYETLEFLLQRAIGVAFLTKGRIPERHMALLEANASQVRAQLGLTTLDSRLTEAFEPHAAPPAVRLEQVGRLARAGIRTQVRLDPILPGLTDDAGTIRSVCAAVADAGVPQIAASALFLRPGILHSLRRHLDGDPMLDALLRQFRPGGRLGIHAGESSVIALPTETRRALYERVTQIASELGLRVRLCACKNPDLATGSCSIAGDWATERTGPTQLDLFPSEEGDSK